MVYFPPRSLAAYPFLFCIDSGPVDSIFSLTEHGAPSTLIASYAVQLAFTHFVQLESICMASGKSFSCQLNSISTRLLLIFSLWGWAHVVVVIVVVVVGVEQSTVFIMC